MRYFYLVLALQLLSACGTSSPGSSASTLDIKVKCSQDSDCASGTTCDQNTTYCTCTLAQNNCKYGTCKNVGSCTSGLKLACRNDDDCAASKSGTCDTSTLVARCVPALGGFCASNQDCGTLANKQLTCVDPSAYQNTTSQTICPAGTSCGICQAQLADTCATNNDCTSWQCNLTTMKCESSGYCAADKDCSLLAQAPFCNLRTALCTSGAGVQCNPETPFQCKSGICKPPIGSQGTCQYFCSSDSDCSGIGNGTCKIPSSGTCLYYCNTDKDCGNISGACNITTGICNTKKTEPCTTYLSCITYLNALCQVPLASCDTTSVANNSCTSDSNCNLSTPQGHCQFSSGTCIASINKTCNSDTDCHIGKCLPVGLCANTKNGCTGNTDCANNNCILTNAPKQCVPALGGTCRSNGDCFSLAGIQNNCSASVSGTQVSFACTASLNQSCSSNNDCSSHNCSGTVCQPNLATGFCTSSADCTGGGVCNPRLNQCVAGCYTDAQCATNQDGLTQCNIQYTIPGFCEVPN